MFDSYSRICFFGKVLSTSVRSHVHAEDFITKTAKPTKNEGTFDTSLNPKSPNSPPTSLVSKAKQRREKQWQWCLQFQLLRSSRARQRRKSTTLICLAPYPMKKSTAKLWVHILALACLIQLSNSYTFLPNDGITMLIGLLTLLIPLLPLPATWLCLCDYFLYSSIMIYDSNGLVAGIYLMEFNQK